MKFGWETREERIARCMKIPAKRKLERLEEMRKFLLAFSSRRTKQIRRKLWESERQKDKGEKKDKS